MGDRAGSSPVTRMKKRLLKECDFLGSLFCNYGVSGMFKKKSKKKLYDKTNKKAVLRCSICTGEQVADVTMNQVYWYGIFDEEG